MVESENQILKLHIVTQESVFNWFRKYLWAQLLWYTPFCNQGHLQGNLHFVCKIWAKLDFCLKIYGNMRFPWVVLLNMLENDNVNLQIKFWLHITSNISKKKKENRGIAPTSMTSQLDPRPPKGVVAPPCDFFLNNSFGQPKVAKQLM